MSLIYNPPPPPPPDWLPDTFSGQYFVSLCMILAGLGHKMAHGALSGLYTGIYVGLIALVATYGEKWIYSRFIIVQPPGGGTFPPRNQLRACQGLTALALILCAINAPMIALFSIGFGDAAAIGGPALFGQDGFLPAQQETQLPNTINLPAIICDAGLLLTAIANSLLISASGSYFWTLITDKAAADRSISIDWWWSIINIKGRRRQQINDDDNTGGNSL